MQFARAHVTDTFYKSISLCMLPTSDRILNGISQNDDNDAQAQHSSPTTGTPPEYEVNREKRIDVVFCGVSLSLSAGNNCPIAAHSK